MNKKLEKLIDRFLEERRKSTGGYAPVEDGDMDKLYGVIRELVALKWGADPDGDRPVQFKLIDRTRFSYMGYSAYPHYWQERATEADRERAGETLRTNLSIALEELDKFIRHEKLLAREMKDEKEKAQR